MEKFRKEKERLITLVLKIYIKSMTFLIEKKLEKEKNINIIMEN